MQGAYEWVANVPLFLADLLTCNRAMSGSSDRPGGHWPLTRSGGLCSESVLRV
jgi:hypothetical protein